jgi:CheY-like chemotaxis protein
MKNESILVVDDDPAVLRLVVEVLTQSGYVVYPASGPEQAIGAAIEGGDGGVADLERANQLTASDERGDLESAAVGTTARLASEDLLGAIDLPETEQRVHVEDGDDALHGNAARLLRDRGAAGQ